jgi:SAM-dependent methyltransferase
VPPVTENYFGENVAARYDESLGPMADPVELERTVDFLVGCAGDGTALEFAIGTGRVAVPLTARGVRVVGIDASAAMLDRLRSKPDASGIRCVEGDMATTRVEGEFSLVYLVFNTIMNLTTQDEQVACFVNAARHLEPGGAFVVEVAVPGLRLLPPGQRFVPFAVEAGYAGVDEYTDLAHQRMYSHHIRSGDAVSVSIPFRYVWPSELDLMARIAGMTLVERWADWSRSSFTDECGSHISVWRLAAHAS